MNQMLLKNNLKEISVKMKHFFLVMNLIQKFLRMHSLRCPWRIVKIAKLII